MDNPIRGRTRPLPVKAEISKTLNAEMRADIHNRFDVEVVDAKTGEVKQRAQAQNVICTALWTRLFTPANFFTYIHYGTGSGTPASTDTSLFAFLGYGTPSTSDDAYAQDVSTSVVSLRRKIVLSETTVVGSTLTEVGIGYGTAAATLCTHAMLKDMNGNQISIAKTNTDIINIYATVFVHFPSVGTMISDGIIKPTLTIPSSTLPTSAFEYDTLLRWLLGLYLSVDSYNAVFAKGLFTSDAKASNFTLAYSSASKSLTMTMGRVSAGAGNLSNGILGISVGQSIGPQRTAVMLATMGSWYSPPQITGEAVGTGDGSTLDFSTSFEVVSGTPQIYVDGVAAAGVTVDTGKPFLISDMGQYFVILSKTAQNASPQSLKNDFAYAGVALWYNPFYSQGIASFTAGSACGVEVSNDLTSWVTLCASGSGGTISVPTEYRQYKYWRITGTNTEWATSNSCSAAKNATYTTAPNVHFASAPASGAVITADYTPQCIAKDANHVFDLTVTIQLGEHTA